MTRWKKVVGRQHDPSEIVVAKYRAIPEADCEADCWCVCGLTLLCRLHLAQAYADKFTTNCRIGR